MKAVLRLQGKVHLTFDGTISILQGGERTTAPVQTESVEEVNIVHTVEEGETKIIMLEFTLGEFENAD